MKLTLLAAASVTALALGAGTASAQYPVLVPHRDHFHVVPAYPAYPAYGYGGGYGGGYRTYSPGVSFNLSFGSPRVYPSGFGYGSGYGGYRSNYGGNNWGGYNRGHYHNGHYHR